MLKCNNMKKVLVIGQEVELNHLKNQVDSELKKEGLEIIWVNFNFDKKYIESLNIAMLKNIIEKERPDCIFPSFGGYKGIELALKLVEEGFLEKYNVKLLGIPAEGIKKFNLDEELIKKDISGWKDIGFEIIRDGDGNSIIICSMEGVGSVGMCREDNIFVAPTQTLANKEYQMLKYSALQIISDLNIEGCCNIRFALNPNSMEYYVIEVNEGFSSYSVFASKATGYPIATVVIKIALGYTLDEITGIPYACFEPIMDYVVVKFPKYSFEENLALYENSSVVNEKGFLSYENHNNENKAIGEFVTVASCLEAAFMKAIRAFNENIDSFILENLKNCSKEDVYNRILIKDNRRIFVITEALRRGFSVEEISKIAGINKFFIGIFNRIVKMEQELAIKSLEPELLLKAKKMGFTDKVISRINGKNVDYIKEMKIKNDIVANFKMIGTYAGEFENEINYYYCSYDKDNEVKVEDNNILVLDSDCVRGCKNIQFNNLDRLYFEPLTLEDIENIINIEKPSEIVIRLGKNVDIKLKENLNNIGVKISVMDK